MTDRIFHKVVWDFFEDLSEDKQEFNKEVIAKQIRNFGNADNWDPNEIIIDQPEVVFCYQAILFSKDDKYDNEEIIKIITFPPFEEMGEEEERYVGIIHATLKADNNQNFPALELLYKLHKQFLNKDTPAKLYLDGLEKNEKPKDKYDYYVHIDFD
ncbi:hypothetical protein HX017_14035 [Myroides marinus]|jgi:hypothetical protein|uniref:Uncharacterized protein n=1 Tax=Myroides marinus TaxID=703342 RepID=A0A1H6V9H3_9FLAO|nr:hypothetical protein [Myroides marinus]MDM1348294.1 hypothetical protein [Myroides marinus]MDM1351798.1 hypothetical protein [Myroides marinus]MDM1355388.1 hypothetical protein [Myroides marinus]MDM1359014.1 hypothetical protein [Myroides marinus]MDM1366068.1 hypothetical protein [Myroides marinus]